eukprot:XP_014068707.1 PREDICTED: pre-mRNA-splicing factor SLU7-like [Salmo salar]
MVKQSYCTVEAGIKTTSSSACVPFEEGLEEEELKTLLEIHREMLKEKKKKKHGSDSSGSDEEKKKLNQALAAEDVRLKQVEEMKVDEGKRKYNSLQEIKEPTEEEMEAFRMKRSREDDPMANFLELGQ